ncbi:MAG: hypothetical protein ACYS47_20160, partial [Planctomycetota bacterium]
TGYAKIDLIEGTFGDGEPVDLTGKEPLHGVREDGTAYHHNAGVAVKRPSPGWTLRTTSGTPQIYIHGPGVSAFIFVRPDHWYRRPELYGRRGGFSRVVSVQGCPAVVTESRWNDSLQMLVFSERRMINFNFDLPEDPKAKARTWAAIMKSVDISAWKGTPVETPEDYPRLWPEPKEKEPAEGAEEAKEPEPAPKKEAGGEGEAKPAEEPGKPEPGEGESGEEEPGEEEPKEEDPGEAEPGEEEPGEEEPKEEEPGEEEPGEAEPGGEEPKEDKPKEETPGDEEPGEEPGEEE